MAEIKVKLFKYPPKVKRKEKKTGKEEQEGQNTNYFSYQLVKLAELNKPLNMASSGKKGKKSKGKTVPLTDFLQESSGGISTLPVKKYNWSDEVEDDLQSGYESRPKNTNVVLPTAPRAARGPDISDDRIPNHPPFIAYISNLPYDVDEEDIADFFANMKISSMRLPRDDRGGEGGKLKGFGYVEFDDRTSLIDAISIIDTNLKGRRIKIDVATSSDSDRRRGGRMEMGRDRPERPEVSFGDWRSGPRSDPVPESRGGGGGGGGGGFSRDRDRDRDRDGPGENRAGAWRDSTDRPSFRDSDRDGGREMTRDRDSGREMTRDRDSGREMTRDRDGGREMTRDRDSGREMTRGGGGFDRDRDRGFSDRDRDRDRGSFSDRGRFGDRGGERDRDRGGGGGFGPRRFGGDREGGFDRDRDRDGDFRRRDDGPQSDRSNESRARPKLVLAPRTRPLEEQAPPAAEKPEAVEEQAPALAVPAASIFGAAKPVDTAARERQIEERLAKEKETKPLARDSSRDNKSRDDEEDRGSDRERDRAPKKEVWGRKREDNYDDAPRKESPERRPNSRGPPPRRNDDRKPAAGNRDKAPPPRREERPAKREERPVRENHERELPKLKEPEPPNFSASNIYAALEPEDECN